jgi:hypothetical protein
MARASLPNGKTKRQSSPSPLPAPQVALYMRVNSEEQAEEGTIQTQRDFLRHFTTLYQLPVADEYADDGVSGTLPLGSRPEGLRLLQDAEAGRFGGGTGDTHDTLSAAHRNCRASLARENMLF